MVDRRVPSDPIGNALTVTPQQFEVQLQTLARRGLHTITARELVDDLHRHQIPQRTVVLTFDDGYANARTYALPLLERYHDTGTFFVISSTIGTPRHLSWADVRAMHAVGMEIAAHGREHVDLTELDARGQRSQVDGCRRSLRRWTGIDATTYAYPSGRYNATTLSVMRAAGIAAAFTEEFGYVKNLAQPYRMPRIRILRQNAQAIFESALPAL
jgi:peptidoglycan/xylan/chitin deacetylase (PgdA/CDA1 family)